MAAASQKTSQTETAPRFLSTMTRFSPREFHRLATEMYSQNLELVRINKTLSLLNSINVIVLRPELDVREVCSEIVTAMVHDYDAYTMAALFCRQHERDQTETFMAAAGDWDDKPSGIYSYAMQTMRRLSPPARHDVGPEQATHVYTTVQDPSAIAKLVGRPPNVVATFAKRMKLQGMYAAKLVGGSGVIGTLLIGMREDHSAANQPLLDRLSEAVGIALDNKLLQEENHRILQRLQRSNDKLRKLDETKDDFISMASHQLRTPLTSVKGYVSMVLDGDGGELTSMQRKLLNQSFVSAQRMVYLISDLLNVSRLRTGKFIIEPSPVNLALVVKDEVSQLVETAKGRGVELTFDKPEHFPTLMLDDTKMRQVIMNFLDNAIYYTQRGGIIDVRLVDKSKTIELTVVDTGIGVPKHEQPHLFTKFYRANNAKRARPDGTGLGLFMAKKVVIAQGGALIFKSIEGKGSTFGFTFAKEKLQPVPKAGAK